MGAVGLAVAALAVWVTWRELGPGGVNAIDLDVYREAGHVVLHGGSPYAASFGLRPPSYPLRYPLPFTYPPVAALLAVPLTWVSPAVAAWLWDLGSVAAMVAVMVGVSRWLTGPTADPGPGPRPGDQRPAAARRWLTGGDSRALGAARWWGRPAAAAVVGLVVAVTLVSRPVRDDLMFGQIDVLLMAACMADVLCRRRRWPTGVLVGLATAVQVAPGIFVVYLLLSRRWAAARTAAVTWAVATGIGALVLPGPTLRFFTVLLFDSSRVGNLAYFSNQSLWGMVVRAQLGPWHLLLLWAAIAGSAVGGLGGAALLTRLDPSPWNAWRAALLVGLTWALVSPVTWIHGMVWLLPAGVVAVASVPGWWRLLVGAVVAVPLCTRVAHIDQHPSWVHLPGALVAAMVDVYGILAAALLAVLSWQAWTAWRRAGRPNVPASPTGSPMG